MVSGNSNPVREYRLSCKRSLRKKAREWGTSLATLSRIENGVQRVPENLLPKISEDTGVPRKILRPDLAERLSEILNETDQ